MPSELQRVAQGLVECLDQVPQVVGQLQNTATKLRQQASWIADLSWNNPYGRQAALLLDDAARRCDEAAYRASLAPAKATVWAQTMVGGGGTGPVGGVVASGAAAAGSGRPTSASTGSEGRTKSAADGQAGSSGASETLRLSTSNPEHRTALNNPPPNSTIVVDGRFTYQTDARGRVVRATAKLDVIDLEHPRDEAAQRKLVGKLPGDHAGHIFARIFQGPGALVNLTPMEGRTVNLSAYKKAENAWKVALAEGRDVRVEVSLVCRSQTNRPDIIVLQYWIDGELTQRTIRNQPHPKRGPANGNS